MWLRANAFNPLNASHGVREVVRDNELVELFPVARGEAWCEDRDVDHSKEA